MSKENTQFNIGKILEGEHHRDAIHIAVIPVIANQKLVPGQDIGFEDDTTMKVGTGGGEMIGIVDPFLKKMVQVDQQFHMFLYPNTVTGLRHEYEHPALVKRVQKAKTKQKEEAEIVVRDIASRGYADYDELLQCARRGNTPRFGTEMYDVTQDEKNKFWDAIEVITGFKASQEIREDYWSCAC